MTMQYDDQKASKLWVVDGARIEIKKDLDNIFLRVDGYNNELQHKSHNLPKMPCLRLGKNQ